MSFRRPVLMPPRVQPCGPGEVDQLATGEVELEDAARLVVDLRPGLVGDGRVLTLEEIHHAPPQAADAEGSRPEAALPQPPPFAAAAFSTARMEPVRVQVGRDVRVEHGAVPADPLEVHHRVLDLLVLVVQ
jgi:hypothetical protein